MECYEIEKQDGLESAIASTGSVVYTAKLELDLSQVNLTAIAFAEDLFPVTTLMVSTGVNKNDDIADRYEVWNARHTPIDKPFNIEHLPGKIIGHIVASRLIDDDFHVIVDETKFDDLPSSFHIMTDAVIYRHLKSRDPELEAFAAQLIEEIQRGEWFVSMECLFSNFDYGEILADGSYNVVQRNADTAYLTKHLRAYGGNGVYNDKRIGRIFRNVTYTGKGLVRHPANPESVIFIDNVVIAHEEEKEEMSSDTNVERITALENELAEAKKTIEEFDTKQFEAAIAKKDEEIASLKTELEAVKATAQALEASKAEVDAKLAEAQTLIAEQTARNIAVARISTLVDKGVEKSEAEQIVTKYSSLNDELFAGIVELVAAKVVVPTPPVEEATEDVAGESTAESADVEGGEVESEPALASETEQNAKNEELRSAISSYFEDRLSKTKK